MVDRVKDGPSRDSGSARRGLEPEVFDPIESLNPARMVYAVAIRSLARDLAEWIKRGWTVGDLRADMFPQTVC